MLRGKCLSVDEPVQSSTPALAILGSLVTPTPKHVLTLCRVCPVAVAVSRAESYIVTVDK